MLKQQKNQIGLLLVFALILVVSLGSCKKHLCDEGPMSPCQEACEMDPIKGWCGTPPVELKYYFNPTTGQCEEYIYAGGDVPFETLQECQDCDCIQVVNN